MQTLKLREMLARVDGAPTSGLETFIKRLDEHLGISLDNTNGPFLAGGSVRRAVQGAGWDIHKNTDFDLFFKNEEQYKKVRSVLMEEIPSKPTDTLLQLADFGILDVPGATAKQDQDGWVSRGGCIDVKYKNSTEDVDNFLVKYTFYGDTTQETIYEVQLIKKHFFDSAVALIDFFDFTICQFVTDGEELICGDYSLWDLGRKRLAIHKISYPVSSMRRMIKYANQGFYACNGTMSSFLQEVVRQPELVETRFQYVD